MPATAPIRWANSTNYDKETEAGPRTIVESRWKLTIFPPTGQGLLFDLETDPDETCNLWDAPLYTGEKSRLVLRLVEELAMSDRVDALKIANA